MNCDKFVFEKGELEHEPGWTRLWLLWLVEWMMRIEISDVFSAPVNYAIRSYVMPRTLPCCLASGSIASGRDEEYANDVSKVGHTSFVFDQSFATAKQ